MTARRGRLALAAAVAAVAATLLAVLGLAAPASSTDLDFRFDFGTVTPGQVVADERAVEVPVDVTVARVEPGASIDPASGAFRVELCSPASGCVAVEDLLGRALPAGEYALRVRLEVAATVEPGAALSTAGRIVLVERSGALAATGAGPLGPVGILAGVALGLGALVLGILAVRRRRAGAR